MAVGAGSDFGSAAWEHRCCATMEAGEQNDDGEAAATVAIAATAVVAEDAGMETAAEAAAAAAAGATIAEGNDAIVGSSVGGRDA